ncbi:MAG: tetratricopeptide repeat protein [Candidatus Abyssobacteria bacterium SURF_5]|uniref:Tetratricopeptide repeat protein n=1 Tax=Abyssobacteria bacterium (strain SURF_5) TaxID=2093360 RepID=A0A3A4N8Q0_ABYX5|nr:MAG: tetratricopeptide repeat protein [Candidatus Abyssubacteria bacterium SURF_5]
MDGVEKKPTFDDGLTAQMKGDLQSAISIFAKVIEEHPAHAAAHHQMGRCHMKRGDFSKAVQSLETTVRIGPDRVAARLDLGMLYLTAGVISKAKAQFLKALSISASNVKAMAGLGIVHYHERDYGKAIAQFQEACALNPTNFSAHFYLAKIHKLLENTSGAMEEALKAASICHGLIRARPEQPEGYYFLAETFILQDDYKPALQNYLIARDFSPKEATDFFAFGLHYSTVDNYLGIARCYKKLGESSYARYFAQLVLKLDATNEEAKAFLNGE